MNAGDFPMIQDFEDDLSMCDGGSGVFFSGMKKEEYTTGHVFGYLAALFYTFLGVAIIADIFMSAIEVITSVKKRIHDPVTGQYKTVDIWNATVANLTLMALGSSAPEILLSVIELVGGEFFSGPLGPSTIVGSAAFNLFVIIGICVWCIPEGEIRAIKEVNVYIVTASFSVFAYVWLIIIIEVSSPNMVTTGEGVISFLFFPVLIILAYMADIGYFSTTPPVAKEFTVPAFEMSLEELSAYAAGVRRKSGVALTPEALMSVIDEDNRTKIPPSRAQLRVNATRQMVGSKKKVEVTEVSPAIGVTIDALKDGEPKKPPTTIQFEYQCHACLENVGTYAVGLVRAGNLDLQTSVKFKTRDGKAKKGTDYIHKEGTLHFGPGERTQNIEVTIVDDIAFEEEEEFYIDLYDGSIDNDDKDTNELEIGPISVAIVTIVDDDMPGVIKFELDEYVIQETDEDVQYNITVMRKNGSSGVVGCKYRTENDTAVEPLDYEAAEGILEYQHGQMSQLITLTIKARGRYEGNEFFRLILEEPFGGATFDDKTDGGANKSICTVTIIADQSARDLTDKLRTLVCINWDKTKIGTSNWKQQFTAACYCNGSAEEQKDASLGDWTMHLLTFPFKFFFAFVPPTDYANGWVCFFSSLAFIALVTAIIADLATLVGCSINALVGFMEDEITAITFVALGTSLPDLFASMQACLMSEHADMSVGNVTGSNSVNVFLGLGLPFLVGSIYWAAMGPNDKWISKYSGEDFYKTLALDEAHYVVKGGNIVFSVLVFTACALTAITTLYIRRRVYGGELGGPRRNKNITLFFFIGLWLVYIILSIWKIKQNSTE